MHSKLKVCIYLFLNPRSLTQELEGGPINRGHQLSLCRYKFVQRSKSHSNMKIFTSGLEEVPRQTLQFFFHYPHALRAGFCEAAAPKRRKGNAWRNECRAKMRGSTKSWKWCWMTPSAYESLEEGPESNRGRETLQGWSQDRWLQREWSEDLRTKSVRQNGGSPSSFLPKGPSLWLKQKTTTM